jgi:sporulation protein YlmC with PRC-barrel domain
MEIGKFEGLSGALVVGSDGSQLGRLRHLYVDPATANAEWAVVEPDEGETAVVPIHHATAVESCLEVPFKVGDIPSIARSPHSELTIGDERALRAAYDDDILPAEPPPGPGTGEPPPWIKKSRLVLRDLAESAKEKKGPPPGPATGDPPPW